MHNLIPITVSVVSYDEKKFIPSSFIKVIGRVEVGTELDNEFDSWAHILFWLGDQDTLEVDKSLHSSNYTSKIKAKICLST